MKNTVNYKGYTGSVEFSEEDEVFFGKVLGVRSLISYEGTSATELINDFHQAVDDYLAACAAEGTAPEKAYKGSLNIRIDMDLHRQAAMLAICNGITLNRFIEEAIREKVMASGI